MNAQHRPQTRNYYDKTIIEDIVRRVLNLEIYPTSNILVSYASHRFGTYVCQSTIANWFSVRKIKLVECKKRYEIKHGLRAVDYYLRAPNSLYSASPDEPSGEDVVTIVVVLLLMNQVVTVHVIQHNLVRLHSRTYSLDLIQLVCQRYLLTYRLPDVARSGITYGQYKALVYNDFPNLFNN